MPYQDGYPIASSVALTDILDVCQGSTGVAGTGATRQTTVSQFLQGLQSSPSYADDAAAAVGGIAVGHLYRNGSVVQIRIT